MNLKVLDISHHNDVSSFDDIKAAGIVGIIHKATQGRGMIDKMYSPRRQAALDAGLLWGAYHFNSGEDVQAQVDHFFEVAAPDDATLMALDFEDYPASNMSIKQAKQFLQIADDKLGRKLVLYSGNRIKDLMDDATDDFLGGHRLWLAQYGPAPHPQASWDKQWLWQYSEHGQLNGASGAIDLNSYDGDDGTLIAEWSGD